MRACVDVIVQSQRHIRARCLHACGYSHTVTSNVPSPSDDDDDDDDVEAAIGLPA